MSEPFRVANRVDGGLFARERDVFMSVHVLVLDPGLEVLELLDILHQSEFLEVSGSLHQLFGNVLLDVQPRRDLLFLLLFPGPLLSKSLLEVPLFPLFLQLHLPLPLPISLHLSLPLYLLSQFLLFKPLFQILLLPLLLLLCFQLPSKLPGILLLLF